MKFIVILLLLFDIVVICVLFRPFAWLDALTFSGDVDVLDELGHILLGGCSGSMSFQRPSRPLVGFLAHPLEETNRLTEVGGDVDAAVAWPFAFCGRF